MTRTERETLRAELVVAHAANALACAYAVVAAWHRHVTTGVIAALAGVLAWAVARDRARRLRLGGTPTGRG